MQRSEDRASAKAAPRAVVAACVAAGLVLCAPATFSTAGTAPDYAASPPSAEGDKVAAVKEGISRAITSYGKDVQNAYYRELIANPKVQGEITVSFVVRPEGDVGDVRVDRSSLNSPPLEEEIVSQVRTWKFPPFDGEPVPITVPYKFHPN